MSTNGEAPEHHLRLGPTSTTLEDFTDSYILFRETTRRYREAYEQLEAQFETLNIKLEETNQELRKSLEEKDRVSNYLNNILESMTGGVIVVDLGGAVTLFNQAAEQILGRSQSEALGRPYEEVMGAAPGRQDSALYTLDTGTSLINRVKEMPRPDGRPLPLGFSTSVVRDESGKVLGALEVFNDLTEVKRLEAEVQRVRTLAALGEMAATVAHEIRNPLGGIATFAALLGRGMEADDPRRRLVNKITEGVGRLNRIVSSLLTYTRPLRLNTHEVNLVELVEESVAFFEIDLERSRGNVKVTRDYVPGPLACRVDTEQFQQVILNLLQNATQAMPEGGTLSVAVAPDPGHVMLCIGDTGIGMSPEVQAKLFTPFFTTKEDGTGLGLVTCRKIVEAHGGRIRVESAPGTGTRFYVYLPQ